MKGKFYFPTVSSLGLCGVVYAKATDIISLFIFNTKLCPLNGCPQLQATAMKLETPTSHFSTNHTSRGVKYITPKSIERNAFTQKLDFSFIANQQHCWSEKNLFAWVVFTPNFLEQNQRLTCLLMSFS